MEPFRRMGWIRRPWIVVVLVVHMVFSASRAFPPAAHGPDTRVRRSRMRRGIGIRIHLVLYNFNLFIHSDFSSLINDLKCSIFFFFFFGSFAFVVIPLG
jgi:hypothetical protein